MCGIFVSICGKKPSNLASLAERLRAANAARGPDANNIYQTSMHCGGQPDTHTDSTISLEFFVSELHLRGCTPVVQPHQAGGDVLCWNGEIFDGINVAPQENDGLVLFEKLRSLETSEQIHDFFGTIEGPYAFVYYRDKHASKCLYFGRDPLGRRSLLIHEPVHSSPYLILASVSAGVDPGYNLEELGTDHIYSLSISKLNVGQLEDEFGSKLLLLPRRSPSSNMFGSMRYAVASKVNLNLPPEEFLQVESLDHIPEYLVETVDGLIYHLSRSVMLRVRDIPQASVPTGQARVAVLFSGGIDSTVLAYFAHKHISINEPIDLLNVAFENPRKIRVQIEGNPGGISKKQRGKTKKPEQPLSSSYMVPDRVTGLQEVEELRRLCPGRTWNFVEINVPYHESQTSRATIETLMLPGRTVMDMSLALALYFASRGVGQVQTSLDSTPKPYVSNARVLLNGLGSDELLGGYGRHRSAFNTGGWQAVIEELQLEIDRIPTRNLGRDDRVISSHGKETRHPFLSLAVVEFLAALPVHFKMDPRLEVGLGDKMLLRLAARKVGLVEASARKKRAMQFGSHSARMGGEKQGTMLLD